MPKTKETKPPPLLPCPFCGGEARAQKEPVGRYYKVCCGNVNCRVSAKTFSGRSPKEAARSWNKRSK